jgi:hypothetical protein
MSQWAAAVKTQVDPISGEDSASILRHVIQAKHHVVSPQYLIDRVAEPVRNEREDQPMLPDLITCTRRDGTIILFPWTCNDLGGSYMSCRDAKKAYGRSFSPSRDLCQEGSVSSITIKLKKQGR